jgi:hypothetical protein
MKSRWVLACVVGLGVGLTLATLWAILVLPRQEPSEARLALGLGALRAVGGAIAGAVLGAAQAWVLSGTYPRLSLPRWIGLTAAGGFVAALVGQVVVAAVFERLINVDFLLLIIGLSLATGLVSGLAYGVAQRLAWGDAAENSRAWLTSTVIAWLLAALVGNVRYLLGTGGGDPLLLLPGAALAGLVQGLALGLVTSAAFLIMPPKSG